MIRMLLGFVLGLMLVPVQAQEASIGIEHWQVEWPNTRPRDPALAADGRVWFVGQTGDYAAVFDPETESFRRYDLPEGAGPHTVYITRDQEIWYAGNRDAHLGRIDPERGEIERIDMPQGQLKDPHTLYEDSQGRLWFTAQWANQIGRYDRASGEIRYVDVPTPKARPYGILIDAQDTVWVALFGTHKLARITPDMQLTEIELPRKEARPRRLAVNACGVWYVDYAEGYLGRYQPLTGGFKEWRHSPAQQAGPYAMAADAAGRIWFVETHPDPNRLVGFDPDSERFFGVSPIPGGAGAVRHMVYDTTHHALWFGTDTNRLMRADLPAMQAPAVPAQAATTGSGCN
ncbi:MAG: lyase [Gammaproteobacteria bacterium]|nr:lyase [Gammaproteobacteria bacterium]